MEPAPVPVQAALERKGRAVASGQAEARDEEGDKTVAKNTAKRSRKVAKAPVPEPDEAKIVPVKKARNKKVLPEKRLSVQSQSAPYAEFLNGQEPSLSSSQPEKARAASRSRTADASTAFLDAASAGDAMEEPGRKPLSARAARSAAKPGERWTCRLRHVRRNLGSGRPGQLRP
ncbi:hypothetical protein C5L14_02260 [Labrys okinawensis]|uniref:Uncharacterized protein n=1 Tax=Labrys okinawensis TaxID=346911 RepID=A0A2S9QJA2_9HYPH|nr:hypothetical protein C5L14_02260 [Labrys okinawensis]